MNKEIYAQRREHATQFLINDMKNDDWIECLLKYREEVEKEILAPIIQYINIYSIGKAWTNGVETGQIINHINYLNIYIKGLENRIDELETMVKIQNGE